MTPQEATRRRWAVVGLVALVAVAFGLVKTQGWALGLVFASPLLGVVVAWYCFDALAAIWRRMRWQVWKDVNAHYLAFAGTSVTVDHNGFTFVVKAQDVARVLGMKLDTQTVRRLSLACPDGGFFQGDDRQWWFEEEALLKWLTSRETVRNRKALRFRHWLVNDVFPPMRRSHHLPPVNR